MKVLKNYLLNSSYQLLVVLIPIITIPYISRVLGTSAIGVNTFTYAIVQYFVLLGSIGITTYGNREIAYHQTDKEKRSQLFWEITFLRFITIIISLLIFCIFLAFQRHNFVIYLLQGISIIAAAFDISWYFMGMENFKRTVIRNTIVSIITVISIFIFIKSPKDLPIYVVIITGSSLIGNLSLWSYLKKEIFVPKWKSLNLSKHLRPTFLLFLPQIATQIYTIANKTMIGIFDSKTATGFFSQSDSLIKITLTIVTSLGVVMLPHISNLFSKGKHEQVRKMLMKSFNLLTALAVPIMFGIMAIALNFAPFFFGSQWSDVGSLLVMEAPIIILIAWTNVLGLQYLLPMNRMRDFTGSVMAGAIVNIILNLVLIPFFALTGAMIATVLSEITVTVYQFYVLRREFNALKMIFDCWKYFLSGIIMFVFVFYLNQHLNMTLLNLFIQVMSGIVIYLLLNFLLQSQLITELKEILSQRKVRN